MRNFDNLSINYFFAHARRQYFPCLITTENNKEITKTSQPLDKNNNLKQCKQKNKKQNKKITKKQDS